MRSWAIVTISAFVATTMALVPAAPAATMTDATRALLKDLKLDAKVLDGLDAELAVPQSWIDGAKKEGAVKVHLPMQEDMFTVMGDTFKARYPGIEIEYTRGTGRGRAQAPLLAFKRGTYLADVLASWDAMEAQYLEADALIPIDGLPAAKSIPAAYNTKGGFGVGFRLQHWCIGYNTKKVQKSELPRTWDDILTDPRWSGGKIGMAGNVHTWLGILWGAKGTAWVNNYIDQLFTAVKPQIRKENLRAYLKLLSLGEYEIAIPTADFIIRTMEDDGMPITLHCPELVPTSAQVIGIFKGSPHPNAAKLFANWLLSKEGQIAGFRADSAIPANGGLTSREFQPYPDEIAGHKLVARTAEVRANAVDVVKAFNRYWLAGASGKGTQ